MSKITGIDISKQTFDAAFIDKDGTRKHKKFTNNKQGFRELLKWAPKKSIFVMEATGVYFYPLASFLVEKGSPVSVINPYIIKSFAKMKLHRAKTDKKDAFTIAEYGTIYKEELQFWKPKETALKDMYQIHTTIEKLEKQYNALTMQLESFKLVGKLNKELSKNIKKMLSTLEKTIKNLEKELLTLAKEHYATNLELLTGIPGIGKKTAVLLIILTDNFEKFTHYKQLIAYTGTSPCIKESGTSVRGRGSICKQGNSRLRRTLYMCTWSAKIYNTNCKTLYERLKSKGKPEKVIKVALINKLLKQAFGIVRSGIKYTPDHISLPVCYLH